MSRVIHTRVFHRNGASYRPGQEAELEAAGLTLDEHDALRQAGAISGDWAVRPINPDDNLPVQSVDGLEAGDVVILPVDSRAPEPPVVTPAPAVKEPPKRRPRRKR